MEKDATTKGGGAYMEEEMMENVHIYAIIKKVNDVIGSLFCCNRDAADQHRAAPSSSSRNVHCCLTCTADHAAILSAGRRPRPADRRPQFWGGVTPHASQTPPQKKSRFCPNTQIHAPTQHHTRTRSHICPAALAFARSGTRANLLG